MGIQPGLFGGHSLDIADRRGVAISARQVSLARDLLAAAKAVGRAGCMARCVASVAGRARWQRAAEVGGDVSGRQLCSGEKGGLAVGKTKRGKGTKWMVLVDGRGLPLGVRLESASPGEATLAEATLAKVKVPRPQGRPRQKPKRVIADRAYDSDPLRERLKKRGIDLIVPYRKNNKLRRYEDGRSCDDTSVAGSSNAPTRGSGSSADFLVRHENLLATYEGLLLPRLPLDHTP